MLVLGYIFLLSEVSDMNYILILFLLIIFSDVKFHVKGSFNLKYFSLDNTNSIKGIFALLIMMCHSMDYFANGSADSWLISVSEYMKQLIVVPILFYSGFGIMESIQKKGIAYVNNIPVQRALKTFIMADVSVLIYILYSFVSGSPVPLSDILLSLVFWETIVNNTWYFFVIIILYLLTYAAFRIFSRNKYLAAAVFTLLSFIPFFALISNREIFWYNTFFLYHLGVWYSLFRPYVEKVVMHSDLIYCIAMLLAFVGFAVFRSFGSFYFFIVCGCFFTIFIVGLTMKVTFGNALLRYAGKHVFGFYVFHRLPMIVIQNLRMESWEKFVISFFATCILVQLFDYVIGWLNDLPLFRANVTSEEIN